MEALTLFLEILSVYCYILYNEKFWAKIFNRAEIRLTETNIKGKNNVDHHDKGFLAENVKIWPLSLIVKNKVRIFLKKIFFMLFDIYVTEVLDLNNGIVEQFWNCPKEDSDQNSNPVYLISVK